MTSRVSKSWRPTRRLGPRLCCGNRARRHSAGQARTPRPRRRHSEGMLRRLRERLAQEEPAVRSRVTIDRQDITRLDVEAVFLLVTLAFNSFSVSRLSRAGGGALAASRHLQAR